MTQQTPTASARRATRADPGQADQHRAGSCTLQLPAQPWAAVVTRRQLRHLLRAWQLAALTDTAQLMASELVANAVTAAQAQDSGAFLDGPRLTPRPIELSVRRTEVSLIIEVRDPSPELPVAQQAGPMDEGGRGLRLVEILATRWGHYAAEGGGKVVWCEIALADGCPARLLALSTCGDSGPATRALHARWLRSRRRRSAANPRVPALGTESTGSRR